MFPSVQRRTLQLLATLLQDLGRCLLTCCTLLLLCLLRLLLLQMIVEPELRVADFAKAGADIISVHCEGAATIHLHRTVNQVRPAVLRQCRGSSSSRHGEGGEGS